MLTVINFICYIISGLAMILALSATYFAYRMRKQIAIARAMMRHPAEGNSETIWDATEDRWSDLD